MNLVQWIFGAAIASVLLAFTIVSIMIFDVSSSKSKAAANDQKQMFQKYVDQIN